ncbi:hypothetical protein E3N88_07021 [Mikania micrantha]|uniref:Uncharacterized protein n=1 Tax=Mikania micrantha TaxID=192012 RepID=A0A5N6PSF5_9ASTR|nr:hypothetical protein E3N88_07021 [Mikania micrantha]
MDPSRYARILWRKASRYSLVLEAFGDQGECREPSRSSKRPSSQFLPSSEAVLAGICSSKETFMCKSWICDDLDMLDMSRCILERLETHLDV